MSNAKSTQKPDTKVTSPFDLVDTHPENDVVADPEQTQIKLQLDKALKDSFPASDPVSISQPITAGQSVESSEIMEADALIAENTRKPETETKAKVPRENGEPDAE